MSGINRKLVLTTGILMIVSLLAIALLLVTGQIPLKSAEPESKDIGIPALTQLSIRDPVTALKYGIVGYIDITAEPNTPKSLSVNKGGEASITLLLRFISHIPEITETQINIDPKSGQGITIEQYYSITDDKGKIIGKDKVNINKLINYNPSGNVTIKANQTLPVTLKIKVPKDSPSISFPLGAVGITANVPILDDTRVMINV